MRKIYFEGPSSSAASTLLGVDEWLAGWCYGGTERKKNIYNLFLFTFPTGVTFNLGFIVKNGDFKWTGFFFSYNYWKAFILLVSKLSIFDVASDTVKVSLGVF